MLQTHAIMDMRVTAPLEGHPYEFIGEHLFTGG